MLHLARKKESEVEGIGEYATHSNFCAIFIQHVQSLYLLALLLTGDEVIAEQCFLAGFELCERGSFVFKESAVAWSKRSVIKSAIQLTFPRPLIPSHPDLLDNCSGLNPDSQGWPKRVQTLAAFERFVFVMSVLERYSDHECSLLLDCSRGDILSARIRAFQQITKAEKSYASYSSGAQPCVVDADWLECG